MTIEELKAEAKAQGYYLQKIHGYIKLIPCKCGHTPTLWFSNSPKGKFYWCEKCDIKSPLAENERSARKMWNKMMTGAEDEC